MTTSLMGPLVTSRRWSATQIVGRLYEPNGTLNWPLRLTRYSPL